MSFSQAARDEPDSLTVPSEEVLLQCLERLFWLVDWTSPTLVSDFFRLIREDFGYWLTLHMREMVDDRVSRMDRASASFMQSNRTRKQRDSASKRHRVSPQGQPSSKKPKTHATSNRSPAVRLEFGRDSADDSVCRYSDRSVSRAAEPRVGEPIARAHPPKLPPNIHYMGGRSNKVAFTQDESNAILEGMEQVPPTLYRWQEILNLPTLNGRFHAKRTGTDLSNRYTNMKKKKEREHQKMVQRQQMKSKDLSRKNRSSGI